MKPVHSHPLAVMAVLVPMMALAYLWALTPPSNAAIASVASPADALDVTCDWQSMPQASSRWYKVPPREAQWVTINLVSDHANLKGMRFEVYEHQPVDRPRGNSLAAPVGYNQQALIPIGHSNTTISALEFAWTGDPGRSVVVYVQVINANPFVVSYGLCLDRPVE